MPPYVLPIVTLAAILLGMSAGPAPAASGPCLPDGPSPACVLWTGKVAFVADGDTLDIDVRGDGRRGPRRIRITGIQAMELSRYSRYAARRRGACHAREATARLARLVRRSRGRVRLSAQRPSSSSGSRARRSVAVRIGGRWRDVGRILVEEGHALWLPNSVEWAWNRTYGRLAEEAAARGQRLWNPETCAPGPEADLRLHVNWDAAGRDFDNPDGEWFDIVNRGPRDVALGGWWVRDSALRRFTFPPGAAVRAGGSVRVRVGRGVATPLRFFWGLAEPVFENASRDVRGIGDGGYLFDPDGDLRAYDIYR
jgi:endonuclease YncB( thermonuclease family)